MDKVIHEINGVKIAVIHSDMPILTDAQTMLDLLATVFYEDECSRVAINEEAIVEDFFKLSTGMAGEMLQKVINYRQKFSIIGDFSKYTSKPLQDFMGECNRGRDIFFVKTEQEALDRLAA